MPIGPYIGALGTGITERYSKGYDESLDQLSNAVAGRGLQVLQALSQQQQQQGPIPGIGPPGQMPQQPPMQPPMGGGGPPGMPPQMAGGPPGPQGSPPMGGPPGGGGMQPTMQQPMGGPPQGPPQGGGSLDWRTLIQAIQAGNPGVPPQALFGAVNKLVPLMNSQSQLEWRQVQAQLGQQRVDVQARGQDIRADTAERGQDVRADTAKGAQDVAKRGQDVRAETAKAGQQQKAEQFNVREARITAHQMVTADQGWQRLDQQRKALEARIKQGGDRQALAQWRAILDAQHKRTTEVIGAYSANTAMPDETRKQLLKDSDEAYERAIKDIGKGDSEFDQRFRGRGGQSTP